VRSGMGERHVETCARGGRRSGLARHRSAVWNARAAGLHRCHTNKRHVGQPEHGLHGWPVVSAGSTTRRSPAAARPATPPRLRQPPERRAGLQRREPHRDGDHDVGRHAQDLRYHTSCHTTNSAPWRTSGTMRTTSQRRLERCAAATATGQRLERRVDHRTGAGVRSSTVTTDAAGEPVDCYECHVIEDAAPAAYTSLRSQDWDRCRGDDHTATARSRSTRTRTARRPRTTRRRTSVGLPQDRGRLARLCRHGLAGVDGALHGHRDHRGLHTCHGDSDGANAATPTRTAREPSHYPDNTPAHQKHVAASPAGRVSASAGDLRPLHAGNSHTRTLDLINGNFKTVSGAADADATVSGSAWNSITCSNVTVTTQTTPDWYNRAERHGGAGVRQHGDHGGRPITGGKLQISWSRRRTRHPPVRYDLFRLNNKRRDACTDGAKVTVARTSALSYLDTASRRTRTATASRPRTA